MKTKDGKKKMLEALRENHIVLAACRKTGISKSSFYRWCQDDPAFAAEAGAAIQEGIDLVNDAAESNVVVGIKNQDKDMTKFWLTHRHPAYADKIKIESDKPDEPLTLEEEEKMLKGLAAWRSLQEQDESDESEINKTNDKIYDKQNTNAEPSAGVGGNIQNQETAPSGDTT
jgi:hypothetical protein